MNDSEKWKADPMIVIERAVLPVLGLPGRLTGAAMAGTDIAPPALDSLTTAAQMMRGQGPELLRNAGAPLGQAALARCAELASQLEGIRKALETLVRLEMSLQETGKQMIKLTDELQTAVDSGLDVFRARFISYVVEKQELQAHQAKEAIGGLDRISKQIFFISINASVEAARVGDAGKGFLQISTDIRTLSQSAQSATRGLSDLMMN